MTVDQETTELETQVEEEFASRVEEEAPEEEPQETPEEQPEPEPEPEDDTTTQAQRLYDYFQAHPEMAQTLVDIEQGRIQVAPVQQEAPPEDDFNFWNDPEGAVRRLAENQRQFESYIQTQTYTNTLGAIQTGKELFAQQHPDLKPEEVEKVANSLVNSGNFPSYWNKNPNHVGVLQALEERYRVDYFDRGRTAVAKDLTKASAQKRRAASVGTSRASAPRTEPVPQDPKERRQAMVRELEEFMNS